MLAVVVLFASHQFYFHHYFEHVFIFFIYFIISFRSHPKFQKNWTLFCVYSYGDAHKLVDLVMNITSDENVLRLFHLPLHSVIFKSYNKIIFENEMVFLFPDEIFSVCWILLCGYHFVTYKYYMMFMLTISLHLALTLRLYYSKFFVIIVLLVLYIFFPPPPPSSLSSRSTT